MRGEQEQCLSWLERLGALVPADAGILTRSGAIRAAQVIQHPWSRNGVIPLSAAKVHCAGSVAWCAALVWHLGLTQTGLRRAHSHASRLPTTAGLWLQGDGEGALQCYHKALELLPTSLDALAWLAAWYTNKEVI